MTTVNQKNPADNAEALLKGYADQLVSAIQQLRRDQKIADSAPISAYVTNTEAIRSLLKQYRSYVEEQANTVDLVQVNDDAGNPMPENLTKTTFDIGDQEVSVAIEPG